MNNDNEPRIRARVEAEVKDYIHNDLSNTARYFVQRVEQRVEKGDRSGIFLEQMAAVVMTAFSLEAYLNYLGPEIAGGDWRDREPVWEKLKTVRKLVGVDTDLNKRPYSTVRKLVELRDALAHGKPKIEKFDEVHEGKHSELEAILRDMKGEWEKSITPDFMRDAYDDVEAIWKELLAASKIDVWKTLSGASSGINFIEYVPDVE